MSHECPDCYSTCYCGGDIDDMDLGDGPEAQRCTHYVECEDGGMQLDGTEDDGCLDCGTCDSCIERTKAYSEEMAQTPSTDSDTKG